MDEAKGKWLETTVVCEEIEDEDIPVKEKIKDLETVMEVVMRMIPKEHDAAHLYISTAHSAKRELTRKLFELARRAGSPARIQTSRHPRPAQRAIACPETQVRVCLQNRSSRRPAFAGPLKDIFPRADFIPNYNLICHSPRIPEQFDSALKFLHIEASYVASFACKGEDLFSSRLPGYASYTSHLTTILILRLSKRTPWYYNSPELNKNKQ